MFFLATITRQQKPILFKFRIKYRCHRYSLDECHEKTLPTRILYIDAVRQRKSRARIDKTVGFTF